MLTQCLLVCTLLVDVAVEEPARTVPTAEITWLDTTPFDRVYSITIFSATEDGEEMGKDHPAILAMEAMCVIDGYDVDLRHARIESKGFRTYEVRVPYKIRYKVRRVVAKLSMEQRPARIVFLVEYQFPTNSDEATIRAEQALNQLAYTLGNIDGVIKFHQPQVAQLDRRSF
jgi:hypothetical protein